MQAEVRRPFANVIIGVAARSRTSTGSGSAAGRCALPAVVHVNMDHFFASAEQSRNPVLRDKPVLIGREAVLSASWEAQLLGARAGMPMKLARVRCPQAACVLGQFARYAELAENVCATLCEYSPHVHATHEGFVFEWDTAGLLLSRYQARLRELQLHILAQTGLNVSIGAGRTRIIAALGASLGAPRAFCITPPGMEYAFLDSVPVGLLPEVGAARERTLQERGIARVGQLRGVPRQALEAAFGRATGRRLWHHARGLDEPVPQDISNTGLSRELVIEGGCTDKLVVSDLLQYLGRRLALAIGFAGADLNALALIAESVNGFCVRLRQRAHDWASGPNAVLSLAAELSAALSDEHLPLRRLQLTATVRTAALAPAAGTAGAWASERVAV